jgi:hypothetical protein
MVLLNIQIITIFYIQFISAFNLNKFKLHSTYKSRILKASPGLISLPIQNGNNINNINLVGMPKVLPPSNDADNQWQLWFHGRDDTFANDIVNLSTGKIYYATSKNGISDWVMHPDSPVMLPSNNDGNWWWFDSSHVGLGDVIIPGQQAQAKFLVQGGIYMMYIFGGNLDTVTITKENITNSVRGTKMEIGVAISQDGAHWSRVEGSGPYGAIIEVGNKDEFDAQFVGWPCVLPVGKEIRLYYNSYNPITKKFLIGAATSKDGLKFRKLGVVFEGRSIGKFDAMGASRRHVICLESGDYRMWYEGISSDGQHSIGLATSTDGLRWQRVSDEPIFKASENVDAWDSGGVGSPHVVWLPESRRWRMYYVGTPSNSNSNNGITCSSIGIAESTDETGLYFKRI